MQELRSFRDSNAVSEATLERHTALVPKGWQVWNTLAPVTLDTGYLSLRLTASLA
jgi:hypothetical protein